MTYAEILAKIDAFADKSGTELSDGLYELADIIMQYAITPEQAVGIDAHLNAVCPYGTDAGALCENIMIETGSGESLYMLMQFANYKPEAEPQT